MRGWVLPQRCPAGAAGSAHGSGPTHWRLPQAPLPEQAAVTLHDARALAGYAGRPAAQLHSIHGDTSPELPQGLAAEGRQESSIVTSVFCISRRFFGGSVSYESFSLLEI